MTIAGLEMDAHATVPWLITAAQPQDAGALTEIAFAAKRSWGYPETWIQRWRDALTITEMFIRDQATFVAAINQLPVGFAAVVRTAELTQSRACRLEHLWVRPDLMGRGMGRALFAVCEAVAREAGSDVLMIESDPHAEAFYHRQGAVTISHRLAELDGVSRFLPQMEKRLR